MMRFLRFLDPLESAYVFFIASECVHTARVSCNWLKMVRSEAEGVFWTAGKGDSEERGDLGDATSSVSAECPLLSLRLFFWFLAVSKVKETEVRLFCMLPVRGGELGGNGMVVLGSPRDSLEEVDWDDWSPPFSIVSFVSSKSSLVL